MPFQRISAALLAGTLVLASGQSLAQDGSLRQRLKNRLEQRQQAKLEAADTAASPTAINQPGDYRFTLMHDGLRRMYRVHVPHRYTPQTPVPLLVALHGGGGNLDYQADDSTYGMISQSEREGFVVVFPNGYSRLESGKFATWNAGNCCAAARDEQVDDVGFIREMVSRITHQMSIHPQRIYATGMSNGAMMSYRLACEMSDVFTAIAAVAGTDNTRVCQPTKAVSVLHIHAQDDRHVLFNGGAGPDSVRQSAVTNYVSVPATVSKWTQIDGCTAAPQRILSKPGAYCERYAPCTGKAQVQLCVTESGGHSWPGGHKPGRQEEPSQAISANDIMWDFFNR
ncbi:hypothetical protein MIZ03_2423 [Rhodoferax lithotrophicus]|uniref:Poly(3-hydroxybutyrate) depolymerase n=1 Tax=Rhodoferax lithotrophicus TaxID=2798804 RepID=A0ABN6D673_9BURK|nr:PHB depolymerase family esterase [Rhodoferax sp. MIZ03]BCO27535.1 hypothetical protein MIZ03_2423 [Rhodoferax sp. MIZ03]